MIINLGVTEAFVHAVVQTDQLNFYNKLLAVFSVIYIIMSVVFIRFYSTPGMIIANCINMLLRIIYSYFFISDYWNNWNDLLNKQQEQIQLEINNNNNEDDDKTKYDFQPIKDAIPHWAVLVTSSVSYVVTKLSEYRFCNEQSTYYDWSIHVLIGSFCFILFASTVFIFHRAFVSEFLTLLKWKEHLE